MEKSRKGKLLPIIIGVIVFVAVIAVAIYGILLGMQKSSVEKTVNEFFTNLKGGNEEVINEQLKLEETTSGEQQTGSLNQASYVAFFSKLDYKILETKADFKKATVTLEVTNKNVGTIFTNYMAKAFQLAFASAFSSEYTDEKVEKELEEYLKEQFDSTAIENVTNTVTINMKKEDGKWVLESEEESKNLVNAVLPGFQQTVEAISKSLEAVNQ